MSESTEFTLPVLILPLPSILFPGTAIRITVTPDARNAVMTPLGASGYDQLRELMELKSDQDVVFGVIPRRPNGNGAPNEIGTIARVIRNPPKSSETTISPNSILVQGLTRFKVRDGSDTATRVLVYPSSFDDRSFREDKDVQTLMEEFKQVVRKMIQPWGASGLSAMQRFFTFAQGSMAPGTIVDVFSSVLPLSYTDRVALLNTLDVRDRLHYAIGAIGRSAEALIESGKRSQEMANSSSALSKKQREIILRQQLKSVQDKLDQLDKEDTKKDPSPTPKNQVGFPLAPGNRSFSRRGPAVDEDEDDDGMEKLQQTMESLPLPEEGRKIVDRELKRLKRMNANQAEYQVCRTYLETIAELPWGKLDNDQLDLSVISRAREIFDEEHYGLQKVKKRLLEYLAVVYLKQQNRLKESSNTNQVTASGEKSVKSGAPAVQEGPSKDKAPILLLVGPPGVGKTSLAKSVAHALNRRLYRISLGGVRDEAEIRGHRRTYVGAMPGILAQSMRKVGVMNPVVVLDEIDKMGQGNSSVTGDPSAAMLEVLDPEQNYSFVDRYINFPMDLSQVLFIATANTTETIPRPLLDRMEMIYIDGYTYLEKQHIAENYLVPKQLAYNGLSKGQVIIPADVIDRIATKYTREAGVRSLERELGTLCRGKAVEQLEQKSKSESSEFATVTVTSDELPKYLGLEKFHDEVVNDEVDEYVVAGQMRRRHTAGVVNGLAYVGSGNGGLLMFEATAMPAGSGKLKLTGKLGDVISESAQIALSWVRANSVRLGMPSDVLKSVDIHLHAPAGAIPKDGPSAGVAMTLTLVSLLLNREVPRDIAMTGEITLRGKILAVGGVREKLLGAHLAGIRKVLLPHHCAKTVEDECGFLNEISMEVVYVKYIWDVFNEVWPDHKLALDSHL